MSCLFGYIGEPDIGLLDRMADILKHRCHYKWEKTKLALSPTHIVEMGRGIASWGAGTQLISHQKQKVVFGYSGVFFNVPGQNGQGLNTENPYFQRLLANPEMILSELEGAFIGVLTKGDCSFLVRDAAGVKVIYWTRNKKRLVFASEIKALFADRLVNRKLRTRSLPEYLTFSFVPGKNTMFEDIFELQPGNILKYHNGVVRTRRHFLFENFEATHSLSDTDFSGMVRTDLENSVDECCAISKKPPAVFVSGGIDSSAILALTAKKFPQMPIKTFSIHFGAQYANENDFISMIVNRYNTDHTWLEIKPKAFLKKMRHIIWCLDDPIGDPITIPNFLIAEKASKVADVVLNGEGGDPCFGGPKNIAMLLSLLYGPLPNETVENYLEKNYLLSYRKCFSDLSQLLNPDIIKASGGEEALYSIITPFIEAKTPRHFINKLMSINIRLKGANLILVKVDKMTSANQVLALPPLFSKKIIETSMMCPPELKLAGNIEKDVLKKAVEDVVPSPICLRPKSGMMVPVKFWFKGEMKRYAKRILSRKRINQLGIFNADYVHNLMNYDKSEIQSYRFGLKLWMLITFIHWYEQMLGE